MFKKARTPAIRLLLQGLPTAAASVTTALLAPFGAWSAVGLTAFVGAGAWAGMMRRRSTLLPIPERFIGSWPRPESGRSARRLRADLLGHDRPARVR